MGIYFIIGVLLISVTYFFFLKTFSQEVLKQKKKKREKNSVKDLNEELFKNIIRELSHDVNDLKGRVKKLEGVVELLSTKESIVDTKYNFPIPVKSLGHAHAQIRVKKLHQGGYEWISEKPKKTGKKDVGSYTEGGLYNIPTKVTEDFKTN